VRIAGREADAREFGARELDRVGRLDLARVDDEQAQFRALRRAQPEERQRFVVDDELPGAPASRSRAALRGT